MRALPALIVSALLLSGCGGGSTTSNQNTSVRVLDELHTSGNVGVDVNGDFNFFANDLGFDTLTSYGAASNNLQQVVVVQHGTSTVVVPAQTFQFAQNTKTTLLLTGTEGNGSFPPTIVAVSDDTAAPSANDWKLRLIQTSQLTGGAVDVYVLPPAGNINTASPVRSNIDFAQVSSFVEMTVNGAQVIKIVPAGQKAPILFSINLTPATGDIRTLLLKDSGANIAGVLLTN